MRQGKNRNRVNAVEIKSTGESSTKYGPCEVCGDHASEVWLRKIKSNYVFGHEQCLNKTPKEVLEAAHKFRNRYHGGNVVKWILDRSPSKDDIVRYFDRRRRCVKYKKTGGLSACFFIIDSDGLIDIEIYTQGKGWGLERSKSPKVIGWLPLDVLPPKPI